jgi:hypothetical protein
MKRIIKNTDTAYIKNDINEEVIEVKLSQKDMYNILRYRRVLSNDISRANAYNDSSIIKMKVNYGNNNYIELSGEQIFIYENNLIEYYHDPDLLIQNYILEKAYKNNYDKLKHIVFIDSVNKQSRKLNIN